jgi:hypothetical protein
MTQPTDKEIDEWRTLFIMYRSHGRDFLSKDEYERFKVLTQKMSVLLQSTGLKTVIVA